MFRRSHKLMGVSVQSLVNDMSKSARKRNVGKRFDTDSRTNVNKTVETFSIRKNRKLDRFSGDGALLGQKSFDRRRRVGAWPVPARRRDMTTRVRTAKYSQLSTVCHTPYSAGTDCVCGLLFAWVTRRLKCPQYPYRKTRSRFRVCDDSDGFATGPHLGVWARHHKHVPDARPNVHNN